MNEKSTLPAAPPIRNFNDTTQEQQVRIFAHGFARAWCDDCGYDYFVAYSCKGRGVCPSCNTRRMVETAAHLCDHVYPRLPVLDFPIPGTRGRRFSPLT
jgi:hypothetical protein